MRRATGSIRTVATRPPRRCWAAWAAWSAAQQAADVAEAAERRQGAHLLLGELARGVEGVVDRRDDEVLEHVDVGRVDRSRVDDHRPKLLRAGHGRADGPAAGRAFDLGRSEL